MRYYIHSPPELSRLTMRHEVSSAIQLSCQYPGNSDVYSLHHRLQAAMIVCKERIPLKSLARIAVLNKGLILKSPNPNPDINLLYQVLKFQFHIPTGYDRNEQ